MNPARNPSGGAPVLETDRLVLRAHRANDLDACALMWGDPLVARHITGKPSTLRETWLRMLRYPGLWALLSFGYWAVEEKATGAFVGDVGFADFKRDFVPSIEGIPELGWVLAPHARGKGFATEAVGAALLWGDEHLEQPRTVCIIAPENAASIRVAEKCGYRKVQLTVYLDEPTILYSRCRRSGIRAERHRSA